MRSGLCWALLPAILLGSISGRAEDEKTVRMLFTNNSNGKLVDCNCRNDPYGGMAERVSFVREYRTRFPYILLLDSGGYMGLSDIDRKGPVVFRLMEIMGYNAWGVGDQELYRGMSRFQALSGRFQEKMVSATLMNTSGEKLFSPWRMFTLDSVRIAVIGISGAESYAFLPKESLDFTFQQPDSTLMGILPTLRKSSDFILVLSQLGRKSDEELAKRIHGINLIIGGHSQTLIEEPLVVSGCRIVQAGKNGGHVGEIVLTFDKAKKVKGFAYNLIEVSEKYTIQPEIKAILDSIK
jgi:5'-nucleotidase / UDP-sugar diphosphatase